MMKSYLRYEPGRSFGVIASVQSNVVYDWSGNVLLSASGDNVSLWNVRQGSLISSLTNESPSYPHSLTGEVQFIARSSDKLSIAVGYSTGEICIFQYLKSTTKFATLRGHSTGISSLAYNADGTLLASGGRDSDIVIWDTTSLVGQCRLRGHKDAVTGVAFLPPNAYGGGAVGAGGGLTRVQSLVVSVSKDTLLKVWDLSTQHCIQTIVGHRCEIWSLAISANNEQQVLDLETAVQLEGNGSEVIRSGKKRKSPDNSSADTKIASLHQQQSYPLIFTGAADDLLRAYSLVKKEDGETLISDSAEILEYAGCIKLSAEKVTHLELNSSGTMLAALCGLKTIEVC